MNDRKTKTFTTVDKTITTMLSLSVSAWFVAVAVMATPTSVGAARQVADAGTDDPTYPLFAQTCIKCHDAQRILAQRRTKTDWEDIINKMIEKGAQASGSDFEQIYDFLIRHFGAVPINSARQGDLSTMLGLTSKDAAAIVTYRNANGAFADFDALKKVPDIDVKVLEAHRDAVLF